MYPDLVKLPFFEDVYIHTYGALVALGFLVGIVWTYCESKRVGENPANAIDLVFYLLVAAMIGSRLLYVIINEPHRFLRNPLILLDVRSGLVFYGGFIGAVIAGFIFVKKRRLNFWVHADILAPGIALGHVLGRLGCFSAGCCYGKVVAEEHWWTVVFPYHPHSFAPHGVPLYPTQLMEASAEFIIFWLLFALRKRKWFDGQLFLSYIIAYGIARAIIENFRGDVTRGFLFGTPISVSQFVSLLLVLCAIIVFVRRHKLVRRGCG